MFTARVARPAKQVLWNVTREAVFFCILTGILARLTVQAFGIGLIRARLRDCLFIRGAGHRRCCRRSWSLRRRDGGGDN